MGVCGGGAFAYMYNIIMWAAVLLPARKRLLHKTINYAYMKLDVQKEIPIKLECSFTYI